MSDKKISELTPKSNNLETSDVFAIAESNGAGGFTSKGITGDEIKKAITEVSHNAQTGTAYTLVIGDRDKLVEMDNASDNVLTVPPNSSVAFPIGTQILIVQKGSGKCTITAGLGVNVYAEDSKIKTVGQYALATLIKCASDTWYLGGNLEQ